MYIYDDIVSYHDWRDGEIFGIELHNRQIADTQRQFFEMLWRQAESIDKANSRHTVPKKPV